MSLKYLLFTLPLSLIFFGCSTSTPNALNTPKSSYVSKSGYYYILIEKNSGSWKIVDIKETTIDLREKTNQEILKVNASYTQVEPNFEINRSNVYICDGSKGAREYSACSSNLTATLGAKTVFDMVNSSKKEKYLDENLIQTIIKQTNLFSAIERKRLDLEHDECDRLFLSAKTAEEFDLFVEKYSSYSWASTLIPLAKKNSETLKEQEKKRATQEERSVKLYEQKIQKSEKQLEKENVALANIEEKAIRNFQNSVTSFRKNLKKGTETNCGPIVDLKSSAVKVFFPVKNAGDEHWIDTDKIFPKNHGCKFVNGHYIAPATF